MTNTNIYTIIYLRSAYNKTSNHPLEHVQTELLWCTEDKDEVDPGELTKSLNRIIAIKANGESYLNLPWQQQLELLPKFVQNDNSWRIEIKSILIKVAKMVESNQYAAISFGSDEVISMV